MPNDIKAIIRDHWNGRATAFDQSPNHAIPPGPERREWTRLFSSYIGTAPMKVLDVGTGTGEVALLLAEMGHRVTGIDIASDMLAVARTKATERGLDTTFVEGDAEALPFPDASFDVVVNRHLLWTLPHPAQALGDWKRVLIPGGRMIVVDGDWTRARSAGMLRRLTAAVKARLRPSLDAYRKYGIARQLPLQGQPRPQTDLTMLKALGLTAEARTIGAGGDFFADLPFGRRGPGYRFTLFAQKPA